MTLENTLRQRLSKPEPDGFHLSAGGWAITLSAEKSDSLSCAVKELTLHKGVPVAEELRAWGERVAACATGLLEPLRLIEVDAPLGKALLRSANPTLADGKACYYELLLTRADHSAAELRRYAGQQGSKREAVVFTLTHDAIVKLVADIIGSN